MGKNLSAVIIGVGPLEEEILRNSLSDTLEIVACEVDPRGGNEAVRKWTPTMALLYLDHSPDATLQLAKDISRTNACPTVIISKSRDPDNILKAMRSGARDFVYLDNEASEVRRAAMSIAKEFDESDTGAGQVISVFSCKGGSGATTIATNLAGALVSGEGERPSTVLMDLDFQMGDVLVFLDIASSYSVRDLILNTHRLDQQLLHQSLTEHPVGFHVVAQTDNPEDADEIDAEGVAKAIRLLARHYDFVVIDGLRDFRDTALAALDLSDTILLSMTQDVPALKNANRCLTLFQRLGYGKDQVKLVVNRFSKRGDLDLATVEDALQYKVDATISNDFPTVIDAINKGSLLVKSSPRASVTKDYRSLVPVASRGREAAAPAAKNGLLSRWGRR